MNSNDRFYRIATIIAVVAIVAIAVVVVGPKLLEGGSSTINTAKEPIGDVKEDASKVVQKAGEVVDTLTSPVSSVPVKTGVAGIKAMMIADPAYNGGDVEEVAVKDTGLGQEFINSLLPGWEDNLVFLRYDGTLYIFTQHEERYVLGYLYNPSFKMLNYGDGQPMAVIVLPNDPNILPPVTTCKRLSE